jgi:hypothetical protein
MAKLIDILARELKVWPKFRRECIQSGEDSEIYFDGGSGDDLYVTERAEDGGLYGAVVTRAEWQAAVDTLNASKVVEWDGSGRPPAGTICEVLWNESRMEYLKTKVFGVNEHGQPIHRFDEGPKKYQYQADALRTASGTKTFRPVRTAEQVAAEEREKSVNEALSILPGEVRCKAVVGQAVQIMIDAGYRKP